METGAKQRTATFFEDSAVVWKSALGSAIVWEIARLSGSKHPYLAPLTFILCLQATVGQSLRFALYRSLGTVIGVLLIGTFAKSIPVSAWALALALLASTALMKLFRANDLLIHQVALSVLFVLYFENHSAGYALDRAKDTLIGAIVSVLFILFLFPPNGAKKTEKSLDKCLRSFVTTANLVADGLQQGLIHSHRNPHDRLNALLDDVNEMTESLKNVKQGAPFNLYLSKTELAQLTEHCHSVRDACLHFVALTSSFTEDMSEMQRNEWSHKVRSLAVELPTLIARDKIRDTKDTRSTVTSNVLPPLAPPNQRFEPEASKFELKQIFHAIRAFADRSDPGPRPNFTLRRNYRPRK